jgi:UDP-N-acetyl-D-galactosamine dehydrogenase
VDPYYLACESDRRGHYSELINASRRINEGMARYEAQRFVKWMAARGESVVGTKVLVLGATFKPDVADLRNSKVKDFVKELKQFGMEVAICEPHIDDDVYGCKNVDIKDIDSYHIKIKAVKHKVFEGLGRELMDVWNS